MKVSAAKRQRGLTLTELLVVMVIIGLLSTIIVPVYINRMEEARVKVAMGECREIAEAEEQCALIHGYYVPFQMLDDRPKYNYPFGPNSPNGDYIDNEDGSSIRLINPLIKPHLQQGNQVYFSDTINQRVIEMRERWQGPFLTPQRVYTGDQNPKSLNFVNSVYIQLDFPLDPWTSPYRFYSPLGLIGSNAQTLDYQSLSVSFSDGALTNNDDRNFQRYAVVSYGRNLQSDTDGTQDQWDDVIYVFGLSGVDSSFALY